MACSVYELSSSADTFSERSASFIFTDQIPESVRAFVEISDHRVVLKPKLRDVVRRIASQFRREWFGRIWTGPNGRRKIFVVRKLPEILDSDEKRLGESIAELLHDFCCNSKEHGCCDPARPGAVGPIFARLFSKQMQSLVNSDFRAIRISGTIGVSEANGMKFSSTCQVCPRFATAARETSLSSAETNSIKHAGDHNAAAAEYYRYREKDTPRQFGIAEYLLLIQKIVGSRSHTISELSLDRTQVWYFTPSRRECKRLSAGSDTVSEPVDEPPKSRPRLEEKAAPARDGEVCPSASST